MGLINFRANCSLFLILRSSATKKKTTQNCTMFVETKYRISRFRTSFFFLHELSKLVKFKQTKSVKKKIYKVKRQKKLKMNQFEINNNISTNLKFFLLLWLLHSFQYWVVVVIHLKNYSFDYKFELKLKILWLYNQN